ncbi:uncharacterized protein At4g37920 isoform X2 [Cucumis sativus]|uniref:Uncharacterized protein n=1 Tax=Cucumis sativus TaxID=3659 RepID=A0A0A0LMH6_CUCSA|nr:uncharacterized protein At4g37920 isoform X2 [Cucumis sativus]KGN63115.1 hypothetical protein Csa_022408 [Cucumis sativus]
MELHSATLHTSFSFSIRSTPLAHGDASAACSPSLPSLSRITIRNFSLGSKSRGFPSLVCHDRPKKSSFSAFVRGVKAVPSDCNSETLDLLNPSSDEPVRDVQNAKDSVENLDQHKMTKVCDKLIEVFMIDKPTPKDWRRLIAFSKEWDNIRPHFFNRCQDRAASEDDPGMKHKLLRFGRKLKEIDEDVQRHNELLEVVRATSPSELGEIISRRRKDFTKEFFVHLHTVAQSYYDDPAKQNALAKLGNSCLAAVQTYDAATENIEALNAAELKFQDIINSPTIDAACRKIDNLAEKNQLDSALVLMITKAWSAAKESNMMKEEAKDILYHLYVTARGNLQRLMPKEIRILKYLLTINDPEEKLSALKDAFTPGEELEGQDVDCLYTTPEELHTWVKTVVDAYHFSREGTLVREARDLMNPQLIVKLEELKGLIEKKFM